MADPVGDRRRGLHGEQDRRRAEQHPVDRHPVAPPHAQVDVQVDGDGHDDGQRTRQEHGARERPDGAEVEVRVVVGLAPHPLDAERRLGARHPGHHEREREPRPRARGAMPFGEAATVPATRSPSTTARRRGPGS